MLTQVQNNFQSCKQKSISIIEMLELFDPNNEIELDFIKVVAKELLKNIEQIEEELREFNK